MAKKRITILDDVIEHPRRLRKSDEVVWHNKTDNDVVLVFHDPFLEGVKEGENVPLSAGSATGVFVIDGEAGTKKYDVVPAGQTTGSVRAVRRASMAPRTGTIDIG